MQSHNTRAGRYLGILVVPRYWNQTIHILSKFYIIDFGIIVILPSSETLFMARRLVIAMLPKGKTWYLQNQINGKDRNILIEQSIYRFFIKTASNIAVFFYTIYRALKLQYRPSLHSTLSYCIAGLMFDELPN